MKHTKTLLRAQAAMAKARLVNGFWEQKHDSTSLKNLNNPDREFEKIYRRVADLLECGGVNPLCEILDRELMAKLDDAAKQRYVLNMSANVNKSIERYNKVC